jgi:hypothetical protein
MPTWSLDYDEFTALCEQLLGGQAEVPALAQPGRPNRGFRGLWFRHAAASSGLAPARRSGLRRGFGFPRGRR